MAKDCTSMSTAAQMAAFRRFVLDRKEKTSAQRVQVKRPADNLWQQNLTFGTSLVCPTAGFQS